MTSDRWTWEEIHNDVTFKRAFDGRTIVRTGYLGKGDIGWEFSDGFALAMRYPSGGCPSCGYGNEPTYWMGTPR